MAVESNVVHTNMECVRDVVINNYNYMLSLGNKQVFVKNMTSIISSFPLIACDKMLTAFNSFTTANSEYYDWWLNYCIQVVTELDGGREAIYSFLEEYKSLISSLDSAEGFYLKDFEENPQAIILLALRIYLEVLDKRKLEAAHG